MMLENRGREQVVLSIHRTFVVRVYDGVLPNAGEISGRVEHVVSGDLAEFRSMEELARFMLDVLGQPAATPEP